MKKTIWTVLTLSAALTLSACSGNTQPAASSLPSQTPAATMNATAAPAVTASPTQTPASPPASTPTATAKAPSVSAAQADISYDLEGSTVTKKADLYQSKQHYDIYVLPDFDASGDTKKDAIRLKGKDDVSLTIERLPEGTEQQPVADQAKKELEAKYKDVRMDTSLRNNKFFQNAIIWNGADTASSTSIFVFYVNGHPFKATIYANKPLEIALLEIQAMVQTVKVTE